MSPILGIWASGASAAANTSFESIATTTVGAGGAANVTFSSIPSTYTHLQLRIFAINASASGDVYMQLNSDTGSNYYRHFLYGGGTSIISGGSSATAIYAAFEHSTGGTGITDILDYANTNKYKTTRTLMGDDRNGTGDIALTSGLWLNTNAISTITVLPPSGSFAQYSSFALYGIKG